MCCDNVKEMRYLIGIFSLVLIAGCDRSVPEFDVASAPAPVLTPIRQGDTLSKPLELFDGILVLLPKCDSCHAKLIPSQMPKFNRNGELILLAVPAASSGIYARKFPAVRRIQRESLKINGEEIGDGFVSLRIIRGTVTLVSPGGDLAR